MEDTVGLIVNMRDSRINQSSALVDDARTLLAELLEENLSESQKVHLVTARAQLNSALRQLNILRGDVNA